MKALDNVLKFWNDRPCNIRHSKKPIGTKEYFDEVEKKKYFVEPHIPGFADFAKWRGKKVLEIGTGIGTDSVNFARAGANYTGIELSENSLELCKQRFEVFGLEGKFYSGNAEKLSSFVPVEKYDLIYSFGVIHHTPNPHLVFEEIKKYCSPDTEVRIMLYSKWCWKTLWIVLTYGRGRFWKAGELVPKYAEAQTGCPVAYTYSFGDIKKLFSGFKIISLSKDHIFPYKIKKYVNNEYERVWYFRWMPKLLFLRLEKHLGWHTLVVAKLKI